MLTAEPLADHPRVAAKTLLPITIGQDNGRRSARGIVRRHDHSSGGGSNAKDPEVVATDVFRFANFHAPRSGWPQADVEIVTAGEHSVEKPVEVAIGDEERIRAAVIARNLHQAMRLARRNGPQQELIDQAEEGCGQADAEGERGHCDEREAGTRP